MRLIAETAVWAQLSPVLRKLDGWGITLDDTKWVDDIKTVPFFIYSDTQNGAQRRVIAPAESGVIFAYSHGKHAEDTIVFAGACFMDGKPTTFEDKVSVIYFGNESADVAELRFVHEYLHAMQLPSDDLLKYTQKFIQWYEKWVFALQKYRKMNPDQDPYWQRKFYRWLLQQQEKGLM